MCATCLIQVCGGLFSPSFSSRCHFFVTSVDPAINLRVWKVFLSMCHIVVQEVLPCVITKFNSKVRFLGGRGTFHPRSDIRLPLRIASLLQVPVHFFCHVCRERQFSPARSRLHTPPPPASPFRCKSEGTI